MLSYIFPVCNTNLQWGLSKENEYRYKMNVAYARFEYLANRK